MVASNTIGDPVTLTGGPLKGLLWLLAVGLPVSIVLLWSHVRGHRVVRTAQRLALVALAQSLAVLLTFVVVNDHYVFYASWDDLLGKAAPPPAILPAHSSGPLRAADGGRLLQYRYSGTASGLTDPVLVHLPPEYDEPAYARRDFPVVVFLAGWNGYPRSWISQLQMLGLFKRMEGQGTIKPFISVFPTVNVALPRDAECTDIPGSTRAFTWLDVDVRHLVLSTFRARPQASSWAAVGYSTGGYCAAKLAYLDPAHFHTAVSMSGYFNALKDNTTGDLWGHSQQVRDHNDLLWLARHGQHPAVDVLVFTTRQDVDSYASSVAFLHVATAPTRAFSLIAPKGAHNLKVLRLALPDILAWVSSHLSAPVAPTGDGHLQAVRSSGPVPSG